MIQTPFPRLEISIAVDVVCPWCFIGKRQFETARAQWMELNPEAPAPQVRWLPFQLNPTMPRQGMPRGEYLQRKFGTTSVALYERVCTAARGVGLELSLDRIVRQPSTLRAHALVHQAGRIGAQEAMVETLFAAYFLNGQDLTDEAVLRDLGLQCGLGSEAVDRALRDEQVLREVLELDHEMRDRGVSGVPCFMFGSEERQMLVINGAKGAQTLLDTMTRSMLRLHGSVIA